MTSANYLLRFDDICPTMNWLVWERIEAELRTLGVKPILAVVPDNRDPKLVVDPPREDFWERVRQWQSIGYTIALHGYQHRYVNDDPGMMKLTAQSEFAGLSRAEQAEKLRQGLAIFEANGVRADAWVAPSHSFDSVTVELLRELGVPVISDGLWPNAFMDKRGTLWIPQQLWQFKRKGGGVWTVCQHHNSWSKRELDYFLSKLRTFAEHMTSVAHVADQTSRVGPEFTERVSAYCNWAWNHRIRPWLSQYRHKRNARLQLGAE